MFENCLAWQRLTCALARGAHYIHRPPHQQHEITEKPACLCREPDAYGASERMRRREMRRWLQVVRIANHPWAYGAASSKRNSARPLRLNSIAVRSAIRTMVCF